MGAAKTTALEQIQTNKVVVYSKTWCPHCTHVKKVFNELLGKDNYLAYELDVQGMRPLSCRSDARHRQ